MSKKQHGRTHRICWRTRTFLRRYYAQQIKEYRENAACDIGVNEHDLLDFSSKGVKLNPSSTAREWANRAKMWSGKDTSFERTRVDERPTTKETEVVCTICNGSGMVTNMVRCVELLGFSGIGACRASPALMEPSNAAGQGYTAKGDRDRGFDAAALPWLPRHREAEGAREI